jgi:hypothetical protein
MDFTIDTSELSNRITTIKTTTPMSIASHQNVASSGA